MDEYKLYEEKIKFYKKMLSSQKKKRQNVSYIRALIFIIGGIIAYYFSYDYKLVIISIFIFSVPFLYFVKKSIFIKQKIKLTKAFLEINNNEIKAFLGDYSIFHNGVEFIDYEHFYSYDLDIFGEGSVFQYLNRTSTISGKLKLADKLNKLEYNKEKILQKQKANEELAKDINWRQLFSATSKASNFNNINEKDAIEDETLKDLLKWAERTVNFINKKIWKYILIVLPVIVLITIILNIFNLIPTSIIGFVALINLSIIGMHLKKINKEHFALEKKKRSLKTTRELLSLIEKKDFSSLYLNKQKSKLSNKETTTCKQISKLNKTLQAFDARLNMIVGVLLNAFLLWDLQILFRLEKMKKMLQESIPIWFKVVAEFDSMISLSNYSYNNPKSSYPNISDKDFYFKITEGGHPLIFHKKRIYNDFQIEGFKKITIITGANMAGKSTFLRTVGINMILGMAGTKVCAKEFIFSPIQLFTSVRTNDSLHKNESYFYAELMRLKKMTDYLKSRKSLFVILDEMLKGTNSNDKHTGSKGLIEQLIKLNASGLAATHDIELGKLAQKHPQNVNNKRFEVEIVDNELIFNYKLKEGISKNLNASFLMKKYGIIE